MNSMQFEHCIRVVLYCRSEVCGLDESHQISRGRLIDRRASGDVGVKTAVKFQSALFPFAKKKKDLKKTCRLACLRKHLLILNIVLHSLYLIRWKNVSSQHNCHHRRDE